MLEVTQSVFIKKQEQIIQNLRDMILSEFATANASRMHELQKAIKYRKSLVAFAKSGKMSKFII